MFVVGLAVSILSGMWLARTRRKAAAAVVARESYEPAFESVEAPSVSRSEAPYTAHEPTDEGVRLERLKTLAALRDSGALTEEEFEAEKRRILGGG